MILPRAFVQQDQLTRAVAEVEAMLSPDVVRIRYDVGQDWTGEPAIFFRVTLADGASKLDRLLDVVTDVKRLIGRRIEPHEQWGVLPYFNFRSESEQAQMNEPAWA